MQRQIERNVAVFCILQWSGSSVDCVSHLRRTVLQYTAHEKQLLWDLDRYQISYLHSHGHPTALIPVSDRLSPVEHTRAVGLLCFPSPLPDNIGVVVIVWRLRGNVIRTALCWIVWYNGRSQHHTYMSSSYSSNRFGLSHWDS